ncbi:MAG: hypothetical protein ABJ308_06955 [Halieaceae bacterium]
MPFSDAHIPGLRISMAVFAVFALLLGSIAAAGGDTTLALTNYCGSLFFMFAYHNPNVLLVTDMIKAEYSNKDIVEKKYLWTSLAVGLLAVAWEFKAYLPLG